MRRLVAAWYCEAGRVYLREGDLREAEAHWLRAAATNPADTESRRALADLYQRHGKIQEAAEVATEFRYGAPPAKTGRADAGTAPGDPHRGTAAAVGPAAARSKRSGCPIQLHEVTEETGISFAHSDGSSGRHYIVETVSTGLATFDYDGDGLVDIYFPNGAPLPGTRVEKPPRHALYKNLGNWRFQDVTLEAGVACTGYGLGATAGDYNNDGHPDLYVSNVGPKIL